MHSADKSAVNCLYKKDNESRIRKANKEVLLPVDCLMLFDSVHKIIYGLRKHAKTSLKLTLRLYLPYLDNLIIAIMVIYPCYIVCEFFLDC